MLKLDNLEKIDIENFKIKNILDSFDCYVYIIDLNGKVLYGNKKYIKFYKNMNINIVGSNLFDYLKKETLNRVKKEFNKILVEKKQIFFKENIFSFKNNKEFVIGGNKTPIFDNNNKIIALFITCNNLTHEKILKRELSKEIALSKEKTYFLDTLLDNIDAFVFLRNEKSIFRYANKKLCNFLGLKKEDIIGKNIDNILFKKLEKDFLNKEKYVIEKNIKYSKEEKILDNNGKTRYIKTILLPYYSKNEKAVLGYSFEITDIKNNEKMLAQQSKLASMGEMINNIAHQWRQPLSSISVSASGIKIKKEHGVLTDEEFCENLNLILQQTEYLSETIDNFRKYFTEDSMILKFNAKEVYNIVIKMLKTTFNKYNIEILRDFGENIKIITYRNELIQVIINIIYNARDALLENNNIQNKFIKLTYEKKDNFIIYKILNNGGNIEEKNIDKIFEPYFSTKNKKTGTGLGLYIAHQILAKHLYGKIYAENLFCTYKNIKYECVCFTVKVQQKNINYVKNEKEKLEKDIDY